MELPSAEMAKGAGLAGKMEKKLSISMMSVRQGEEPTFTYNGSWTRSPELTGRPGAAGIDFSVMLGLQEVEHMLQESIYMKCAERANP